MEKSGFLLYLGISASRTLRLWIHVNHIIRQFYNVYFFNSLQRDNPLLSTLNSIGYSVYTSRGAGVVLAFDCSILLLPVCRNLLRSVRSTALKKVIPFDQSTYFHKCSAYAMLFFTLVHVNAHYTNFFLVEKKFFSVLETTAWELHYTIVAGYTGHIMVKFSSTYSSFDALFLADCYDFDVQLC